MLRDEKLEFQWETEKYLEEEKVYDIFEEMIRGLITELPKDPVAFLMDKVKDEGPQHHTQGTIIIGPPQSERKEQALSLAEYFNQEMVSVSDLLTKELNKKSEIGEWIRSHKNKHEFVDDDLVIELVSKYISQFEKENKNWIIEGYPRTRKQALSLCKLGISIQYVILEVNDKITEQRIVDSLWENNLHSEESMTKNPKEINDEDLEQIALKKISEYNFNLQGVKEILQGHNVVCVDANKEQPIVLENIARILKFK